MIFIILTVIILVLLRPLDISYYRILTSLNLVDNSHHILGKQTQKEANANPNYKKFLTVDEFIETVKNMWIPFTDKFPKDNKNKLYETIYQVSSLRIGFVSLILYIVLIFL